MILFLWFDFLRPSLQFFSHVGIECVYSILIKQIYLLFYEKWYGHLVLFGLRFHVPVNSYGYVETIRSPNHTFSGQAWLSG